MSTVVTRVTSQNEVRNLLHKVRHFLPATQRRVVLEGLRGEERQFFVDVLERLAATIEIMPKIYEQDGMGDDAVVVLHYFSGSFDWWITERDTSAEQHQAFGYAGMDFPELGYISIAELIESGAVELDFHWQPTLLGKVRQRWIESRNHA